MKNDISFKKLSKKQFAILTGVTPEQLEDMTKLVEEDWKEYTSSKKLIGRPHQIGGLYNHLLLLAISYRCGLTQDVLAIFFGVDKATICRSLQRIEKIAIKKLGITKEVKVTAQEAEAVLWDCTEQPILRPQGSEKQKKYTSCT